MKLGKFTTLALAASLVSVSAYAQATRTWVSGVGDDVNPCSRTAPCKTFAGAISKTASGGIIDALDPGGYGAVTVTKPITIEGNGTLASILASGVQGVIVNITSGTNRHVVLRNLLIDGSGTTLGTNGVNFIAGDSLTVEDCYIKSFSTNGILFQPNSTARMFIRRTSVMQCGVGVANIPVVGGTGLATVDDSVVEQNTTGYKAQDNTRNALFRSNFSNNTGDGIFGNGLTGSGLTMMIDGCDASNNSTGIHSNGSAALRVANTTITGNGTAGVSSTASGGLITYTSNRNNQNGASGSFTGSDVNN